jgi:hypothetical protein
MAIYYTDHAPEAEELDIPEETLQVVNHRLTMAGCDFRFDGPPQAGDIHFDAIRESYGRAAEATCNLIKHALAAVHPELQLTTD